MLRLRQVVHLCRHLETTEKGLADIFENREAYCEELLLLDPARRDKPRPVLNVWGPLRRLQDRFYKRVLLPKLQPSPHSHGGIRGRDIKTNAAAHLGSTFVFKTDISNFYPSIHHSRVYHLFVDELECSPDVARLCTKLCTYRNHLALGLITSPIVADRILSRVDRRIAGACSKAGLLYTRYVDDITISGRFQLERSGFASLVENILRQDGFVVNSAKHKFGRITDGVPITSIRVVRGRLDVRKEYAEELSRQLEDAARLASGGEFTGPYFTPGQIYGRVQFVSWVNPGRRRHLIRKYSSIPWEAVEKEAKRRGLIAAKKVLRRVDESMEADNSQACLQMADCSDPQAHDPPGQETAS